MVRIRLFHDRATELLNPIGNVEFPDLAEVPGGVATVLPSDGGVPQNRAHCTPAGLITEDDARLLKQDLLMGKIQGMVQAVVSGSTQLLGWRRETPLDRELS